MYSYLSLVSTKTSKAIGTLLLNIFIILSFSISANATMTKKSDEFSGQPPINEVNMAPIISYLLSDSGFDDTVEVKIADDNIIRVFKGKQYNSAIIAYERYIPSNNYSYKLIKAPAGMTLGRDGNVTYISYTASATAPTKIYEVIVRATQLSTGKSKDIKAKCVVMKTDVLLQGEIDTQAQSLKDEWEETTLSFSANSVASPTAVQLLRGTTENNIYMYTLKSSAPLLILPKMTLPDSRITSHSLSKTQPMPKREEKDGWAKLKTYKATYLIEGSVSSSRLPSYAENIIGNKITIEEKESDSSILFFHADNISHLKNIPILFVHGYTPRGKLGGGIDTWGSLPELIKNNLEYKYNLYEFNWKTNARFVDAATDLADAIALIAKTTNQKVHLIAHSFGGLLSRAYLQGYAVNRPYMDDVASLITLGTPHSGIFEKTATYFGLLFEKGQDSTMFNFCGQLSCHQAGEPTPISFTTRNNQSLAGVFGVNTAPGEFIKKIQAPDALHQLPSINILTLIGLAYSKSLSYLSMPHYTYHYGDGLISYSGQRFSYAWKNSIIHSNNQQISNASIKEKILGVTDYDPNAKPGSYPNGYPVLYSKYGYLHSTAVPYYIKNYFYTMLKTESYTQNTSHDAYKEIKNWLSSYQPMPIIPPTFNLKVKVIDAETHQPIQGVLLSIGPGYDTMQIRVTNSMGEAQFENLEFLPNTNYTSAILSANGYHKASFGEFYKTGNSVVETSTTFPTIELQPDSPAKGKLEGIIIDATTGNLIAGAQYTVYRSGTKRTGTTDSTGKYIESELIRGTYSVVVKKDGYQTSYRTFSVNANTTNIGNASLRPNLSSGQLSIELSWRENPDDLDSHLTKIASNGTKEYHIYYGNKTGTNGDNLNHDDTTSYGPETITIQNVNPTARYIYSVYHYGGSGSITSTSRAVVKVRDNSNQIRTFHVPTSGNGKWWNVFEIINGQIKPCQSNCITDGMMSKNGYKKIVMKPKIRK